MIYYLFASLALTGDEWGPVMQTSSRLLPVRIEDAKDVNLRSLYRTDGKGERLARCCGLSR
jgi:hypothetical protein